MQVSSGIKTKVHTRVSYEFIASHQMQAILAEWYNCPSVGCETVSPVDSISQRLESDGSISSVYTLECGHAFPTLRYLQRAIVKHKSTLNLFVKVEVANKDGSLASRSWQRSHSFVQNFLNAWFPELAAPGSPFNPNLNTYNTGAIGVVNTSGATIYPFVQYDAIAPLNATRPYVQANWCLGDAGVAGQGSWGILIGTSGVAPAATDHNLNTAIQQGSTAGKMVYNAITVTGPSLASNTNTGTLIQTFTNNSGGSITVTEVGIVVDMWLANSANLTNSSGAGTLSPILFTHDLLSPSQAVANGQTLTVTYLVQTTT